MGYGRTVRKPYEVAIAIKLTNITKDAPPYTLKDYTTKRASDDIAELARQLGCPHIILGGHDW